MSGSGSCRDDLDSWLDDLPTEYHDTPTAPERGEWQVLQTTPGESRSVFDTERRLIANVISGELAQQIVTEHNQHFTLIAQRERLLDLLKQTRAFICEATWTETKPRKREAEGLVAQIDAVITTSEQEGRQ